MKSRFAYNLVMRFESLGGTGHGCEFGLFQRHFGAEPLGLLRWADLAWDLLAKALENRFAGVGQSEYTDVFVPETQGRAEYWTRDTRYWMAMRCFTYVDDVPSELARQRFLKRLTFLREKLIQDLETGEKFFVYKNMFRDLSNAEVLRLHQAMRAFGKNELLYIRHERQGHPSGSVERAAPGLLIGYVDHFGHSPTDEPISSADAAFFEICQAASNIVATLEREKPFAPTSYDAVFDNKQASQEMWINSLDALGLKLGTDKESIGNDYLAIYERNFKELRQKTFNLLEIGVAKGGSLRMWEQYFPNAQIIGADINEECRVYAGGRVTIEIGSQADTNFLTGLSEQYKPLIVIDDGSHLAIHNMASYRILFPLLPPGALYVIEDIYLHFTNPSVYCVGTSETPTEYFTNLAKKLNAEHTGPSQIPKSGDFAETIERIEFFRRGVLIEKKKSEDFPLMLKEAWPLVVAAKSFFLWHTLSSFILRHNLGLKQAEEAARQAISLAPKSVGSHMRLADILERQGKQENIRKL